MSDKVDDRSLQNKNKTDDLNGLINNLNRGADNLYRAFKMFRMSCIHIKKIGVNYREIREPASWEGDDLLQLLLRVPGLDNLTSTPS